MGTGLIHRILGRRRGIYLAVLVVLAIAVAGCASAKVEPASIEIEEGVLMGTGKAATGTIVMENTNGESVFEITEQVPVEPNKAFFTVVKTCKGNTYTIKGSGKEECKFEVNAVAGSFTSGVNGNLETTGKINGKVKSFTTPLHMK